MRLYVSFILVHFKVSLWLLDIIYVVWDLLDLFFAFTNYTEDYWSHHIVRGISFILVHLKVSLWMLDIIHVVRATLDLLFALTNFREDYWSHHIVKGIHSQNA